MNAMMLTGIWQMEMRQVPDPMIVNDNDVLIRMKVVGVCGSDVHYYKSGRIGSQVVEYPFPVGHEGAGEVVKTGAAVTRVRPGDRIAIEPAMPCWKCDQCLAGRPHTCRKLRFLGCPGQAEGCLSEYIVMPETSCFPIPDHMSYDEAALSEPLAIGVYAVNSSIPMEGAKVGILGFGPIGISVMLPAISRGAGKIYVTDKVDERVQIAKQHGAAWAGNPDKEDIVQGITSLEPNLLDVIFECCGQQEAADQAIELLKPGGKLMVIGIPEFDRWSFPSDQMRRKEITIQNVRRQNETLDETLEMIASSRINVRPLATHRFALADTKQAFDMVAGYRDGVMKAMIDF
ncbi:MAG: alcohol dehydrogenase catalytic domain-containing protein [Bacteroidales bacterium]|nr:alcohol dehydrogenase catalytic domain-containing protein [Bacteroidales bacterium]MDT8431447.1 alcohol dehydrogenase catalytic domain-containing protein [Bacteroidales bacterium]